MIRNLKHYSAVSKDGGTTLFFTDGMEEFQMVLGKLGMFKMVTDLIMCAGESGLMDFDKTLAEICKEIERKYSDGSVKRP